ncbi:MAG: ABC transporter permease [Pirellulaceae bacterium]
MKTSRLLLAELWHRKMNVSLSLFALIAAATLFVAGPTLLAGYQRETNQRLVVMKQETEKALAQMQVETEAELVQMEKKAQGDLAELDQRTKQIMRELGFNLRIVHRNTDMTKLYADFVSFDMPEEYLTRLAESPEITKIVHLVATLRQMVDWEGKSRLIVGFAPEATQSHMEKKAPMGLQIKQGFVYLGNVAAEGHDVGESVEILGKTFEIARILPAHGKAEEDIAICMHLKDAQEVLNKPGKISEILALGCKCKTVERIEEITQQLEVVLPETKVTEMRIQAIARQDQRNLVGSYYEQAMADYAANRAKIVAQEEAKRLEIMSQEESHRGQVANLLEGVTSVVTPLVVLVCTIWVGLLAWSNVRERRNEIGLLRAIGKGSSSIVTLFLGKAILLGLGGGLLGCAIGYVLAWWLATGMFEVSSRNFIPSALISLCTILGTPLIAAIASYLPTLYAVVQDPAVVLMEN